MQVPLTPSGSLKPSGLTPGELRELAQARLEDAEVLITAGRHSGAAYLCGYSVELSLKARICDTLGWQDYQIGKAFDSFKTHELKMLRELSGWKMKITTEYLAEWSAVEFCVTHHPSAIFSTGSGGSVPF